MINRIYLNYDTISKHFYLFFIRDAFYFNESVVKIYI